MIIKCFPSNDIGHNLDTVKAFTSNNLKILAFGNSKHYFIYFNNLLYNSSNIKSSIFHNTTRNYSFIYLSLSLSLSLFDVATLTTHHSPSPQTKPQPTTTQSPPPPLQLAHFSYHNQNPTIHNQTQPDFNPLTLIST